MKKKMTTYFALVVGLYIGTEAGARVNAQEIGPQGMVLIRDGLFYMGDRFNEGYSDEFPVHLVHVSQFYMDKYEVTKLLWDEVYEWAINHGYDFDNEGLGKGPNHPVHSVNWYDAVKWCNARSEMEGRTPAYYTSLAETTVYRSGWVELGNGFVNWKAGYRLPTETEWEMAAHGDEFEIKRRFPWADANTITHSRANYFSLASESYDLSPTFGPHPDYDTGGLPWTSPVGTFAPNSYGLYDMAGNVMEWCWSIYAPYSGLFQSNPRGPDDPRFPRMLRGGSWSSDAYFCRNASRYIDWASEADDTYGFRSVLVQIVPDLKLRPVIEAEPPRPTYGDCPPKLPGKDSLIVVTHGWNPDVKWLDNMTNVITAYLAANRLNNWQVHAHKWVEKAQTSPLISFVGAEIVLRRGKDEGNNLGKCNVAQGWSRVHLISHSAGAALIQTASQVIKSSSPNTTVHLTLLDPFVGFNYGGKVLYGNVADWSDNYSSRDVQTEPFTDKSLDHAYNVDVTWLDSNKVSLGTYRSSWNGGIEECFETVTSHEWPHQFYLKTITESWPDAKGFGFPLSKEGGNWRFATNQYKVGNNPPLVLGSPDPSCIPDITIPPPDIGPFQDFLKLPLIQSETGMKEVNGTGFRLTSGSPAWLAALVPVTNPVNFVSFETKFLSDRAEGLLSVFWDTNTLGSIDERVALPNIRRYTFGLPTIQTNGTYPLGFRLDAFSALQSSVMVTNVAFGFAGVRGSFSLSFTGSYNNRLPVLQLNGPAGFNYIIETSTNLIDWSAFAILINTNGIVRFVDTISANVTSRFYRAVTK